MRVDNLSNYTSNRLSEIIEQRFGQKVELDTLDDGTLDMFKDSVVGSMKQFESAMAFNTQSQNPKYYKMPFWPLCIEINVWAHSYKILLVFEVPYGPRVKGMPKKLKLPKVGKGCLKLFMVHTLIESFVWNRLTWGRQGH